jgi:hypothetical protein
MMASTVIETKASQATPTTINLSAFPDGLKTSGQHPPVYSRVRPYSDFPKVHGGPTLWKAEDYRENPELWTHHFTNEEIEELGAVTDDFIKKDLPLTGISKVSISN